MRTRAHTWNPKDQRPEFWNNYNSELANEHTMRVFPISNWTEKDVWRYIQMENIDIVPLYFSKERPVIQKDGMIIMRDDDRLPLDKNQTPKLESIRFRTLGCYPLTAGCVSKATTLQEIIDEISSANTSERSGRLIDHDTVGSMELKKREGYF